MHRPIRIVLQYLQALFLYLVTSEFNTFGECLHLLDLTGVGTSIEISGLLQASMVGPQTLIMAEIDAVADLLVADPEAVHQLLFVFDFGD